MQASDVRKVEQHEGKNNAVGDSLDEGTIWKTDFMNESTHTLPQYIKDGIVTKFWQMFAYGEKEYIKSLRNYHLQTTPACLLMHPSLIPVNCPSLLRQYPSISLQASWTSLEKETLKKYLL